ncbi:MAG TPA: RNA polymerase sigma factor [Kofleriaceae bacterium]
MDDLNDKTFTNLPVFGEAERQFVYSVARRIVGAEAADDIAQDAMLLAYVHRDAFRGDSRYRTWLYRIAATAALGYLRKRKRSREQLATDPDAMPTPLDPAASPEAQVAEREAAAVASKLLETLDPMYRDVVVLRTELSEAQTAERLGISIANVKVRAHRARAQLRTAFDCAA